MGYVIPKAWLIAILEMVDNRIYTRACRGVGGGCGACVACVALSEGER